MVTWTEEELQFLKDNYEKMPTKELSYYLQDRDPHAISQKAYKLGLQSPRRLYFPNEDVFDEINEFSAYWLGFLAADGCVREEKHEIALKIKESDFYHLEKFKNWISPKSPIRTYDNMVELKVHSNKLFDRLCELGIIPRKTYVLKYPDWMPQKLHKHFVRGFTDGDGTIYHFNLKKDNYHTIAWGVVGTEDMVSSIIDILKSELDIDTKMSYQQKKNCLLYRCRLVSKNAIKVLDWLYKDSEIYLDRKYKLYTDWVTQHPNQSHYYLP